MKDLVLQDITTGYIKDTIIQNLNLVVQPKKMIVLMGISGSGKTTLLKTILGILKPSVGKIILAGKDITNLPIEQRNIGYLSQDYGLFPHLNVADNITYGLRTRNATQKECTNTLATMLTLIEMKGFEKRNVLELSGGQKQRVGLARALAIKPDLFLLDEALSNIDQVTKCDVAADMKKLFDTLDIPIILVTHQYEDAQFFDAHIAIMMQGIIEQIGTYDELIAKPKTPFIKRLLTPFAQN